MNTSSTKVPNEKILFKVEGRRAKEPPQTPQTHYRSGKVRGFASPEEGKTEDMGSRDSPER